ncbi:transcription repressor OFP7-like, partial [Nymphaea colorata]
NAKLVVCSSIHQTLCHQIISSVRPLPSGFHGVFVGLLLLGPLEKGEEPGHEGICQERKASSRSRRRSNSTAESCWFSSEEDETETLLLRLLPKPPPDYPGAALRDQRSSGRRKPAKSRRGTGRAAISPAWMCCFRWILPRAFDGKVKESFAVVKRSRDPYHDFMKPMMEIIREKEMAEVTCHRTFEGSCCSGRSNVDGDTRRLEEVPVARLNLPQ